MASANFLEEALNTEVDESAVSALVGSLESQLVSATTRQATPPSAPCNVQVEKPSTSMAMGSSSASTITSVTPSTLTNVLNSRGGTLRIVGNMSAVQQGSLLTNGGLGLLPCVQGGSDHGRTPGTIILMKAGGNQTDSTVPMTMILTGTYVNTTVGTTTTITGTSVNTAMSSTTASSNVQLVNKVPSMVMIAKPVCKGTTSQSKPITSPGISPSNMMQLVNASVTSTTMSSIPGFVTLSSASSSHTNTMVATTTMPSMVMIAKPATSQGYALIQQPFNPCTTMSGKPISSTGYTMIPTNSSTPVTTAKPVTSTGYAIIPQPYNAAVTSSGYTIISGNAAQHPTLGKSVTTSCVSTVYSATSDVVTNCKPSSGIAPRTTYAPTVLQLVNVKGVPSGVGTQKNIPSRVIIGGQPGAITLQSLANLPPGHILMRTESGGHILRIGAAPTVPPTTTTTTTTTGVGPVTQRPPATSHKEKCQKFLSNLLELSSREPPNVQRDVRTLIQDLIDAKLEPEEFCERLERLLNASPQPCLTGFLRKNLPHLRQSLATGELVIQGIRPPNLLETLLRQQGVTTAQIIAATPTVTTTQAAPRTTQAASQPTSVRAPYQIKQEFVAPTPSLPAGDRAQFHVKQELSTAMPTLPTVVRAPFPVKQEVPPNSPAVKVVAQSKQPTTTVDSSSLSRITIATKPLLLQPAAPKLTAKVKEKKSFSSIRYAAEDDINDVAAMGGVNLAEEAQRILGSTEYVGTQIRSCKDELLLHVLPLQQKIKQICAKSGLDEPSLEVAHLISHACQERLRTLLEKVSTVAEHRIEALKEDPQYEIYHDVKGQLRFLEELDRMEMRRHEDQEREFLLRAAKSRSKTEDPEYSRLKVKAKEMQRAEMEELRQRDANQTALQAIGPRKKAKLDMEVEGIVSRQQMRFRPRIRRISMHDLVFVLRHETPPCNSTRLLLATLQC